MLARSFLTPEKLNISDKQFNALVQVLGMLERGELPWHKKFDMTSWPTKGISCGTVGCIGFWAESILEAEIVSKDEELLQLFYADDFDLDEIKPEHAAQALRNYLGTGKANWASVLA